jgi:hypothetical protein
LRAYSFSRFFAGVGILKKKNNYDFVPQEIHIFIWGRSLSNDYGKV